jgi:hypothetical protein
VPHARTRVAAVTVGRAELGLGHGRGEAGRQAG